MKQRQIHRHVEQKSTALGLFFMLLFLLLLTACNKESEIEEVTVTIPAAEEVISEPNKTSDTDSEPTVVLAAATIGAEEVDNNQEPATYSVPTATAEPIESADSTATPEATPTALPTATPQPRVFVTPKSRTQWRAGSGELFIPFDNGIKNFQYYLYVPEHWYGVFEMRQDTDDAFLFNYIGDPDKKQEVFRVQAFPEQVWAVKKAAGDEGTEFHSLRNVTFVYYLPSENPFSDEEAELFQQMIDDVPQIISEELEIVSRRFNKNE